MKRIISFAIVMVLSFSILALPASAAEKTPSENTVTRVNHEILTGKITNDKDVITVALMEYSKKRSGNSEHTITKSQYEEPSLTITQVLEEGINAENGSEEKLVAITGLLVVDEDCNQLSPAAIEEAYRQSNASFGTYQVYATHTMYIYQDTDYSTFPTKIQVKLKNMATRIVYGSSVSVSTSLQHQYRFLESGNIPHDYYSSTTANPSNNTNYYWTPSTTHWITIGMKADSIISSAIVKCNGETKYVTCRIDA